MEREAVLKSATAVLRIERVAWFYDRCAADRGSDSLRVGFSPG
jgi:hypothetical protein